MHTYHLEMSQLTLYGYSVRVDNGHISNSSRMYVKLPLWDNEQTVRRCPLRVPGNKCTYSVFTRFQAPDHTISRDNAIRIRYFVKFLLRNYLDRLQTVYFDRLSTAYQTNRTYN